MAQNNRLTSETGFVSKAQRKNSAFSGKRTPHGAQKLGFGKILFRTFLSLITVVLCAVIAVLSAAFVVLNGPCKPLRDRLVLSAMQASAIASHFPSFLRPCSGVTVRSIVATNSAAPTI